MRCWNIRSRASSFADRRTTGADVRSFCTANRFGRGDRRARDSDRQRITGDVIVVKPPSAFRPRGIRRARQAARRYREDRAANIAGGLPHFLQRLRRCRSARESRYLAHPREADRRRLRRRIALCSGAAVFGLVGEGNNARDIFRQVAQEQLVRRSWFRRFQAMSDSTPQLKAIVLAGGKTSASSSKRPSQEPRACRTRAGKTMLDFILAALERLDLSASCCGGRSIVIPTGVEEHPTNCAVAPPPQ